MARIPKKPTVADAVETFARLHPNDRWLALKAMYEFHRIRNPKPERAGSSSRERTRGSNTPLQRAQPVRRRKS